VVALNRQPLFAVTSKAFIMHFNITVTKWPSHANEVTVFCFDFSVLKVFHERKSTTMNTITPIGVPKRTPAPRPLIKARSKLDM
jgi:hypothetical protein